MAAKDAVGRYGERVVARRLDALGWEVLDRNWRCALGELDIVAADHGCLVAVEVKTRRTATFGSPLEAVTPAKVARLRKLAGGVAGRAAAILRGRAHRRRGRDAARQRGPHTSIT